MSRTLTRPANGDALEAATLEHPDALFDPMPDPERSPYVRALMARQVLNTVGSEIEAERRTVGERRRREVLEAVAAAWAGDGAAARRHLVAASELLAQADALERQRHCYTEAAPQLTTAPDPLYTGWQREHGRRRSELAAIRSLRYTAIGYEGAMPTDRHGSPDTARIADLDEQLADLQAERFDGLRASVRRYRSRHG